MIRGFAMLFVIVFGVIFYGIMWVLFPVPTLVFFLVVVVACIIAAVCEGIITAYKHNKH